MMPSGPEAVATPRQRRGEWLNPGSFRDKAAATPPLRITDVSCTLDSRTDKANHYMLRVG